MIKPSVLMLSVLALTLLIIPMTSAQEATPKPATSPAPAKPAVNPNITEDEVRFMLRKYDQYTSEGNQQKIFELTAPDAKVVEYSKTGEKKVTNIMEHLRVFSKNVYSLQSLGIKVVQRTQVDELDLKGPKATVKTTGYYFLDAGNGRRKSLSSPRVFWIEKRDGKLLFTGFESKWVDLKG